MLVKVKCILESDDAKYSASNNLKPVGPRAKGLSDEPETVEVDHFHLQSMSCMHGTLTVTITPILQMRKLR